MKPIVKGSTVSNSDISISVTAPIVSTISGQLTPITPKKEQSNKSIIIPKTVFRIVFISRPVMSPMRNKKKNTPADMPMFPPNKHPIIVFPPLPA